MRDMAPTHYQPPYLAPAAEPAQHKALDFWVLLLLISLGPERRKAAEATLRKKLADGHADAAWMERAIAGHEARGSGWAPGWEGEGRRRRCCAGLCIPASPWAQGVGRGY